MNAAPLMLLALAGVAHASDRVVLAPTAELPAAGEVLASGLVDRHGGVGLGARYGLAGLAEVELAVEDANARVCASACTPAQRSTAAFRLGAREDAWFAGMPALAFGIEVGVGGELHASDAYVVASRRFAFVTLHAGALAAATAHANSAIESVLRPIGGVELVPPTLPKTTLLADVTWQPRFADTGTRELAFAWGVRYQALRWGAIELAVRHDASVFGDPDVLVRVTGRWGTGTLAPR